MPLPHSRPLLPFLSLAFGCAKQCVLRGKCDIIYFLVMAPSGTRRRGDSGPPEVPDCSRVTPVSSDRCSAVLPSCKVFPLPVNYCRCSSFFFLSSGCAATSLFSPLFGVSSLEWFWTKGKEHHHHRDAHSTPLPLLLLPPNTCCLYIPFLQISYIYISVYIIFTRSLSRFLYNVPHNEF